MAEAALSPLLPMGARVLCAVSGGADSVCLLSLCRERGDLGLLCAHYDHGIRGEASREDARFVEELCRDWDIPFFLGRGDVPALAREWGTGMEEAARIARYGFLYRTAEEQGADFILTAHTLNDNAETVLLNISRGTGLRGLCGIPPVRGNILRPMLGLTRQQVEEHLRSRGLPWREDESNGSDDYARNRVRHYVLPALEEVHPGAVESIARMTETLREDEEYLSSLAEDFLKAHPERVPVRELSALPPCLARRVLRKWTGAELTREHTDRLLSLCSAVSGAAADIPGGRIIRVFDCLEQETPPIPPIPERELRPGDRVVLPEQGYVLRCREGSAGEIHCSLNTFAFSCANICGSIFLTSRRSGDKLRLPGREGSCSVKKRLTELRIPACRREGIPVLRDEAGVLAVYGIGQAQRSIPRAGERCIIIEIEEGTAE